MESRVASLDAHVTMLSPRMDRVESKLDLLSERVTRIEKRIAHLPTKETVVKIAVGTITAMAALVTFQSKIQGLFGVIPPH